MAKLKVEDLTQTAGLSIEDVSGLHESDKLTLNDRTSSQLAANEVALTGDMDSYGRVKGLISHPETRGDYVEGQKRRAEAQAAHANEGALDILTDPTEDDQMKLHAARSAFLGDRSAPIPSTTVTLAEESLVVENEPTDDEMVNAAREALLDDAREVAQYKNDMTKLINGERGEGQGFWGSLVDMGELMVPLAEQVHQNLLREALGLEDSEGKMMGDVKRDIFQALEGMTIDQRREVIRTVVDTIRDNEDIVFPDGNDLMKLDALENMLIDDDYSNLERYFDNLVGVVEIFPPAYAVMRGGQLLAKGGATGVKSLAAARRLEQTASRVSEARRTAAHTEVSPSSPIETVGINNPKITKDMRQKAIDDPTDETAKAVSGTNKTELLAKTDLPEPEIKKGEMPDKVNTEEPKPEFEFDESVKTSTAQKGNLSVTNKELKDVREAKAEKLAEVEGMRLRKNSIVIRGKTYKGKPEIGQTKEGGLTYRALYSPTDTGWKTAQLALANAKAAFGAYRIPEEGFVLMTRKSKTGRWTETTIKDEEAAEALRKAGSKNAATKKPVDYAIAIDFESPFMPEDLDLIANSIGRLSKGGWVNKVARAMDYMSEKQLLARWGQGSLMQHVLDPASLVHPLIVRAASVAFDKPYAIRRVMNDMFEPITRELHGLSKQDKASVTDYLVEANRDGVKFSMSDLQNRMSPEAAEVMKKLRFALDQLWHVDNIDMVQTLRARGIKAFVHEGTDTKMFGTPLKEVTAKKLDGDILNAAKDNEIISAGDTEAIEALYKGNGEIVKLDNPITKDGKEYDYIWSPNTGEGGYVREIYNTEKVMPYRDGYYPVKYEGRIFIYENVKRGHNKYREKVFGVAKDSAEAKRILQNLKAKEGLDDVDIGIGAKGGDKPSKYNYRMDKSKTAKNDLYDQGAWDVSSNTGRTSQRWRGERLGDVSDDMNNLGADHLKDPLEAISEQIMQMSRRVPVRPFLETSKRRFTHMYKNVIEFPIDPNTHQPRLPSHPGELKAIKGASMEDVGDARATFNYLYALENGYINLLDEGFKNVVNTISHEFFGRYLNAPALEKAGYWIGERSPNQAAKTLAFKMFLSLNPGRQALIQRGQILQLGAHNPKYAFDPSKKGLFSEGFGVDMVRGGASKDPHYSMLLAEMRSAGIIDAVDANTLIRDREMSLAEKSIAQKVAGLPNKAVEFSQKVGFDAAEQDVLITAYLSARNKFLRENPGADITSERVRDQIQAEARSWTLNMNRAGEMPYSQNTLGVAMQFMSFRHKALLQPITNKNLTKAQRLSLAAYTTLVFGMDATVLRAVEHIIPDDFTPEQGDIIKQGVWSAGLNGALTLMSGEDQNISFKDMAPVEAIGGFNVLSAFFTDQTLYGLLKDSPAGSMFLGNSPKVVDAFKAGMRAFTPMDYDDPALKTNPVDVIKATAHLASGYSTYFKGAYALKTGKAMSSSGRISDHDVTEIEALFRGAFGLQTQDETQSFRIFEKMKKIVDKKGVYPEPGDIDKYYDELKRHITRRGKTMAEDDLGMAVLGEMYRVFEDDYSGVGEHIMNRIKRDISQNDLSLVNGLIDKMGFIKEKDFLDVVRLFPEGPNKDLLMQAYRVQYNVGEE